MEFWKNFKRLFSNEANSAPEKSEPTVTRTVLERTEHEKFLYQQWLVSEDASNIPNWLWEQYQFYQIDAKMMRPDVHFLMIPSVGGFVLHFNPLKWESNEFMHFFDYCKGCLLDQGYWCELSDIKTTTLGGQREVVQRHYLKPPRPKADDFLKPMCQRYGNVMVMLTMIDGMMVSLKFSATHYNDRKYLPAMPFEDLLESLCFLEK